MRRQVPERFLAVRQSPPGQGIDAAGKRPVRMHRAAVLAEENAVAVFVRTQHGAAGFRVAFEELCRREHLAAHQAQDLLRLTRIALFLQQRLQALQT